MEREDRTASKVFASKGNDSRLGITSRWIDIWLLNSSSASRYNNACDVSMHVREPIRLDRGGMFLPRGPDWEL